jgi:hypothetical protein
MVVAVAGVGSPAWAGVCQGDIDNSGAVGIGDLLALLAAWGPCPGCPEDLDMSGSVGIADLLILLSNWGPCPEEPIDEYTARFDGLPAIILTDAGPQPGLIEELDFKWRVDPALGPVVEIMVEEFSIGTSSAQTNGNETGGISFLLEQGAGMWDKATGFFHIDLQFEVGYWLIDEVAPPANPPADADETEHAAEPWFGVMTGNIVEMPDGNLVLQPSNLQIQVVPGQSVTNQLFEVFTEIDNGPVNRKNWNLPKCPADARANVKTACIQPVIVCDADGTNCTGASLAAMMASADAVWGKVCIEFEWRTSIKVNNPAYKIIENADQAAGLAERNALRAEVDPRGTDNCIEVFFVTEMVKNNGDGHAKGDGTTWASGHRRARTIVSDVAVTGCFPPTVTVLAHELGHAMGHRGHTANDCMKPGGASPNCPTPNPTTVNRSTRQALGSPLLREKNPKEQCCNDWNDA